MYFGLFVYMETENTSRNNSVSHEVDLGVIRSVKWLVSLYISRRVWNCSVVWNTKPPSTKVPGRPKRESILLISIVGLCLSTASSFALRSGFHGLHADHPAWLSCARGRWILPALQPLLDLEETKLAISWVETTSFKLFRIKVAVTTQSGKV